MPGRKAKSTSVISKHLTSKERDVRQKAEEKLTSGKPPLPPKELNDAQKKIFRKICRQLKDSGILCDLDVHILTRFAIATDRLTNIEGLINGDFDMLFDKELMAAKDKYTKDFFRCCGELCLSPQARAKIALATLNAEKEKEDPLVAALKELD